MDRRLAQSSNVRYVGYDAPFKTLEVEFHSARLYQYPGVPETMWEDFVRAASRGPYFHEHIRGGYPDSQVR